MRQAATIYFRRGQFLFDSESRTTAGFWIGTGSIVVVNSEDGEAVAAALRSALAASRTGVSAPPPEQELTGPLLAAAGVKSWSAFVKGTKCVGAALEDGVVTLTPDRKVDRAGNYVPISEKARQVRLSSSTLGSAVVETFADAI